MKYYLTLYTSYDKPSDYQKLDLSQINEKLNENNNLRALVEFTSTFKSEKELKDFLLTSKLCTRIIDRMSIALTFQKESKYLLRVPYEKDKKYIDKEFLFKIIKERLDKNLISFLMSQYKYNPRAFNTLKDLKGVYLEHKDAYEIEIYIKEFLENILYDPKTKKLKYRELYNLGMIMSLYNARNEQQEEKKEEEKRVEVHEEKTPEDEYEQLRLY